MHPITYPGHRFGAEARLFNPLADLGAQMINAYLASIKLAPAAPWGVPMAADLAPASAGSLQKECATRLLHAQRELLSALTAAYAAAFVSRRK